MKKNITYQFKYPLGDCISENNNIYVSLTSTTLLRRLTMHLSDTSSIAQRLKKHSCLRTEFQKILTQKRNNIIQSRYYVHFRANTLGKGMNPLILLAMG